MRRCPARPRRPSCRWKRGWRRMPMAPRSPSRWQPLSLSRRPSPSGGRQKVPRSRQVLQTLSVVVRARWPQHRTTTPEPPTCEPVFSRLTSALSIHARTAERGRTRRSRTYGRPVWVPARLNLFRAESLWGCREACNGREAASRSGARKLLGSTRGAKVTGGQDSSRVRAVLSMAADRSQTLVVRRGRHPHGAPSGVTRPPAQNRSGRR